MHAQDAGEGNFTVVEDDSRKLVLLCEALAAAPGRTAVETDLKVLFNLGTSMKQAQLRPAGYCYCMRHSAGPPLVER